MTDCHRILALLDVYVDDETTPETNALVQEHVSRCAACAEQLHSLRRLRSSLRDELGAERAAGALHQRVRASLVDGTRSSWSAVLRQWIIPATAAALVVFAFLRGNVPESAAVESAVAEHVACAIAGRAPVDGAAGYQPATSMPWVPDPEHHVRILDAHACGRDREYKHLVVERDGAKASILIANRAGGDPDVGSSQHNAGAFEVSVVGSPGHVAYLVIERARSRALRAWREPALQRVQRFLQQLEGP